VGKLAGDILPELVLIPPVSHGYFGVFDGNGSTHRLAGPHGSGVIEEMLVG